MTNHDIFKYCPRCAGSARLEDERKVVCGACGFGLYLNTAAAVAGLIFDEEGRLLVARRSRDPQKGLLDLPGGFADYGEDAESALRREMREELGTDVENIKYFRSIPNVYRYGGVLYHTLDLFFTCAPTRPDLILNDEITEILYIYPQKIAADEIAFDSMKKLFELF